MNIKILHIDDSPHKISLGLAIGLFIAWTPLLGLHILLVIALTMLLRANKFAALVSVWVSVIFSLSHLFIIPLILSAGLYAISFLATELWDRNRFQSFLTSFSPQPIS